MNQQQTRQTPAVRPTQQRTPQAPTYGPIELGDPRLKEALEVAKLFAASGYFRDAPQAAQAFAKIVMGAEVGFAPMASMNNVFIIDGKGGPRASFSADAQLQLMERHGVRPKVIQLDDEIGILEWYRNGELIEDRDGDDGEPRPARTVFDINRAKQAGLVREGSPWKSGYVPDMLFARCVTRGRKRYCPEATAGLSIPVTDQEELDEEPLDTNMRKAMMALVREKGVTDEQRAELANKVREGVTSWAVDGGLTNGDGRKILAYLELMPDKDMVPELAAALEASAKDEGDAFEGIVPENVEGSPAVKGSSDGPESAPVLEAESPLQTHDRKIAETLAQATKPKPGTVTVVAQGPVDIQEIPQAGEVDDEQMALGEEYVATEGEDPPDICGEWASGSGELCTLEPGHAPRPHSWAVVADDGLVTEEQITTMRALADELGLDFAKIGMGDVTKLTRQKAENLILLWARRQQALKGAKS